jgi:Transposase, Mutator family
MQAKTTAGPVVLERPKLRGTPTPFTSRLLGKGVSRTNALEALVLSGFVRGLSVRDVEAALAEALGPEATLSKSTVSRICQVIADEYDAFARRGLGEVELDYLFLDAAHFRMHPDAPDRAPVVGPPARTAADALVQLDQPLGPHPGLSLGLRDLGARPRRAPCCLRHVAASWTGKRQPTAAELGL